MSFPREIFSTTLSKLTFNSTSNIHHSQWNINSVIRRLFPGYHWKCPMVVFACSISIMTGPSTGCIYLAITFRSFHWLVDGGQENSIGKWINRIEKLAAEKAIILLGTLSNSYNKSATGFCYALGEEGSLWDTTVYRSKSDGQAE